MAQVEGRTKAARRQRLSLVDGYGDDATTRGSQPQQLEMNERLLPQQLNSVFRPNTNVGAFACSTGALHDVSAQHRS